MTSVSDISFGDFSNLCKLAALPACRVFGSLSAGCSMQAVTIFGGSTSDLGELIAAFLALLGTLTIAYRTHTKYAAVGRLEMGFLNFIYISILITEMALGILGAGSHAIVGSINGGLVTGFFWVLFLNAIVTYQMVEDGSTLSVWGFSLSTVLFSTASGILIHGTALGNSMIGPATTQSPVLFALLIVWPMISIVLYCMLTTILVIKELNQSKALINLFFAFIFIIVSAVFTFVINNQICVQTIRVMTGILKVI
eukprot:NODE_409_length_9212_cov_0.585537.p4 type:complete len:254 gc:universal NODE_409_length_9212_cov_0.585537:7603-6842(-)